MNPWKRICQKCKKRVRILKDKSLHPHQGHDGKVCKLKIKSRKAGDAK